MNKIDRSPSLADYEKDFALWSAQQAALLRSGRLTGLDLENVAEEIESLGRSDKREIESRLKALLAHLLKWRHQPHLRPNSWKATIREQRRGIAKLISESPSLRPHPASVLSEEYDAAVPEAANETGLPEETFPAVCPFTIEQILDPNWLPDGDAK